MKHILEKIFSILDVRQHHASEFLKLDQVVP